MPFKKQQHTHTLCAHFYFGNTRASHRLHPVLDTVVLALNEEYVDKDAVLTLQSTDTLALIPPIAGG